MSVVGLGGAPDVTVGSIHEEFLATASQAMESSTGPGALDALGWWDMLGDLRDPVARVAVFAAARGQGRALSDAPVLGGILAQPYLAALHDSDSGATPGSVVATVARRSRRRGTVQVVLGDLGDRRLLVDEPGRGAHLVEVGDVELRPVDLPGRLTVHEVDVDLAARQPDLGENPAAEAREEAAYLGRVAAAAEMLGAAERIVALAVEYAGEREQFGHPIGTFQAVRHLLALADTDCVALDSVVREALVLADDPPPRWDEIVKATAGRNGRRACEHALQVFGGIGFTAEHVHHHHHSRVLLLDALLGSSAELTHGLGAWLRTTGTHPGYPAAILDASTDQRRAGS